MTFDTRVYARSEKGELLKFDATEVESFAQAIAMTMNHAKTVRALCVVPSAPKAVIKETTIKDAA